jgi:hypothetical protein
MEREGDTREQRALQVAYRHHLRAMTIARQAASQAHRACGRDPEARRVGETTFRREMARIAAGHRAWLREHGITVPPAPLR